MADRRRDGRPARAGARHGTARRGGPAGRPGPPGRARPRARAPPGSHAPDVMAIAPPPHDPRVLYVGTHATGVLRTVDGGTTWAPANGGGRRVGPARAPPRPHPRRVE